ncbi:MAG: 5-(carboxyamino)imidazole ribonucleotide synthase [Maribacter sp.]|jgi:5-(carboxyamino)imidazole ribonucleotide synthase
MFKKTIGILGGGQLGKMTALAAQNWDVPLRFLDVSNDFPAGKVCPFFEEGSFKDYDAVMAFGRGCDIVTIEIEAVNTEALKQLEKEGKIVHPKPSVLEVIKDKGLQKQFYADQNIATSDFILVENKEETKAKLETGELSFPFVQKARVGGYDGKGVAVIKNEDDFNNKWLKTPSVIEDLVPIEKELAVIVARNESGETAVYPTVEMLFSEEANLVEFLLSPANITAEQEAEAKALAIEVIKGFNVCGLLAVEMFLTPTGEILVNEVAPRPHNSGHHTIDACITSQYEQMIRAITNTPLGSTKMTSPAIMLNLLGEPNHTGKVYYQGVNECLALEGVKVHIYGKKLTKPYRKMGHVTIVDQDTERLREKARFVQKTLKVFALD